MQRITVFLLAAVPVISLVAVVLLVCGEFSAQRALVIGIPLAFWLARPLFSIPDDESGWPRRARTSLVLLLLLATLLRWPPALHLQSVSDQGVYMAMAAYFVQNGSLDVTDDVRESLATPEAIARFDANNIYQGIYYQPGIYADRDKPGHYIFQFYHVHPLWMAIFGGVLGLDQAVWSQVFFALLSLIFGALIAERLTRDWRFGIAFAGLLACLPLHVFFSKFPISEVPTLALSFMALYAVLRGADDENHGMQSRWLVLAALAFAAMFLTRISGFVYLPLIYFAALLCHAFVEDARVRRTWGIFWLSVFASYFASVAYGLVWSGPYARDIYAMHLGKLLSWVPWMIVAAVLVSAAPFALLRSDHARARLRSLLLHGWSFVQRWNPLLLLVIVLAGAVRVGLLAFTDFYQGNLWYDLQWEMSHGGSAVILRSALVVAAENMGPVLVFLLPVALWKPGGSPPRALLTLMVLVMIAYTALLQWFLPFQYYYSRYLMSEVIPFVILLIVVRGADWWRIELRRRWISAALALTGIYFAWFAWPLIGLREAAGAESSLARIASQLDGGSVLLVDETSIGRASRFVTPLRMWFWKDVYNIRDSTQIPAIVHDLRRSGVQDVLLLSAGADFPAFFAYVMRVHFEQTTMERSQLIPRHTEVDATDFVLSRLDDSAFASMALTSGEGLQISDLPHGCCTGFYPNDVWTMQHASLRGLVLPKGSWRRLVVTMHGLRPDYADSGLVVRVNGKELHLDQAYGRIFEFSLENVQGPVPLDLELETKTFVPRKLGLNNDPRPLGVDIDTLRAE